MFVTAKTHNSELAHVYKLITQTAENMQHASKAVGDLLEVVSVLEGRVRGIAAAVDQQNRNHKLITDIMREQRRRIEELERRLG